MNKDALVNIFSSVEMLSEFKDEELVWLADYAKQKNIAFGDAIITAGESAKGIYIVKTGMVRIFSEKNGKEHSIGIKKKGEVFNELSALRDFPAEYSVRASAKTELIFIPVEALNFLLEKNQQAANHINRYVVLSTAGGLVSQLFNLKGKVSPQDIEGFIHSFGIKRVRAGGKILDQNHLDDRRLYVIRQGEVDFILQAENNEYPIKVLSDGEVFGETSCLLHQASPVMVKARTDVVLWVIPEQTVHDILKYNPELTELFIERSRKIDKDVKRQQQIIAKKPSWQRVDLTNKTKHGEKILKRFSLVEQAEEMDCGAACLAMLCKHYDIPMTLGKLRDLANVTIDGATLESLASVGESLGFTTNGLQCTYQSLASFELPFIAHWEGYHYIMVYGISKDHIWVADPALGFKKMTRDVFEKGWTGTCLLFTPNTDMIQVTAVRSPWIRFVSYLKPHKKILGYLLLATAVIQLLGVAPPVIIQNILDRVVVHQNVELLNMLMIGFVVVSFFSQLTILLRTFLMNFMVRKMDFAMMSHFFKHTLSLPLSFFAKRRTGDIIARFQENQTIRDFLTESTISTILNVLMVFIYFSVLFIYNVKMTLLLIACVIPFAVLTLLVTPKIKKYARQTFEASTDAESILMETMSGAESVKAMGVERAMRLKWEKKYAKSLNIQYNAERFDAIVSFVGQLLNSGTTIIILWVGANMVLSQELTVGQLMAFNMLMGSVLGPLLELIGLWDELHETGVAMERLGDVLDIEPEQKPADLQSRVILPELAGNLKFEDVYFRYSANDASYVLENINFEIKPGEMVAIVGHSGSGKTTLAKLMVGFYAPSDGKMWVDGYDANDIDKEHYRRQIGYVMQSNLLFSGSIAENIAMGDDSPDQRRMIEVAKLADAHSFINKMPKAYQQIVGERGMGLSGGQMQRLCIARALYHNPSFLLFDEATSALDSQSEGNILKNMKDMMQGRTAVVIAHRLSTIMSADKILVLYNGNIVEQGSHGELIDRAGMYYQLVHKQMAGDNESV